MLAYVSVVMSNVAVNHEFTKDLECPVKLHAQLCLCKKRGETNTNPAWWIYDCYLHIVAISTLLFITEIMCRKSSKSMNSESFVVNTREMRYLNGLTWDTEIIRFWFVHPPSYTAYYTQSHSELLLYFSLFPSPPPSLPRLDLSREGIENITIVLEAIDSTSIELQSLTDDLNDTLANITVLVNQLQSDCDADISVSAAVCSQIPDPSTFQLINDYSDVSTILHVLIIHIPVSIVLSICVDKRGQKFPVLPLGYCPLCSAYW